MSDGFRVTIVGLPAELSRAFKLGRLGLSDLRRRLVALEKWRDAVAGEMESLQQHCRSTLDGFKELERLRENVVVRPLSEADMSATVERAQRILERNRKLVDEERASVGEDLLGQRLYTQAEVDELVAAARSAATLMAFDLDDEARDRRVRALERELDGFYVGRRGRRVAGGEPDDVWCKGCGHETASAQDGSLCGDCGDVA